MKKKIIIVAVAILLIIVTFTGTVLAENTGLIDGIKSKMKTTVNNNTNALLEAANIKIQDEVEKQFSDVVTYQSNRANNEISTYINAQVENLSTSASFNNAAQEIVVYTTQLIAEEKTRVDQAIANMLN
jgi:predicted PurR-regulated permease PerM